MKTLSFFSFTVLLSLNFCGLAMAQELLSAPPASKVYVTSPEGDFELNLTAGKAWSFKTPFGKLSLPTEALDQIQISADGASVDVHTIAGDRWQAEFPKDLLQAVKKAAPSYTENRSVGGVRFIHPVASTNAPVEGLWQISAADQGTFSGRLLGAGLKVDGGLCPITLKHEQIHRVAVLQGEGEDLELRVRLKSGHVYSLKPLQNRVSFMDSYGNTLKVALNELEGFGADNASAAVEIPALSQRVSLVLEGGAEQAYEIPGSLIVLNTDRGELLLPTSELLEMRRMPGEKPVWVQTVYGDVFVGRIDAKTWRISSELQGAPSVSLSTRDISEFSFGTRAVVVRDRQWWHCGDGSRVRGTFKRSSYRLRISRGGESSWENIPTSGVQLLEPVEGGRITIASGGKRFSIKPIASELEMMLDFNGEDYALPWNQLVRVEKLQAQNLSLLEWMKVMQPDLAETAELERPQEVLLSEGSYWMGRQGGFGLDDEQPAHKVSLNAFYVDQFEVSVAQFRRFVEQKNYKTEAERSGSEFDWTKPGFPQEDNEPVVFVSWFDAVAYCNWRSREAGLPACYREGDNGELVCDLTAGGYRLPTEAEWEFVASERGAVKKFVWGDSEAITAGAERANFSQKRTEPFDGYVWTAPVDAFPPNALGVSGLEGNVWEWCEDWYHHDAYFLVHRRKTENPVVLSGDAPALSHKVMRGGSFSNELDFLRCASRGSGLPIAFAERIGFRCVRGIVPSEVE